MDVCQAPMPRDALAFVKHHASCLTAIVGTYVWSKRELPRLSCVCDMGELV